MPVPFSEGEGQMSVVEASTISVHLAPIMQKACLLLVAQSPHRGGEPGSHTVLCVLANSILQTCTRPLFFVSPVQGQLVPLSRVWLDRPLWCKDVHLQALTVSSLGPTDVSFITNGEILGLKKQDSSKKVIFVDIKALLIWVMQDGLDLVQALIRWLGYFCSSLWTLTVVAYIQANLSLTLSMSMC